MSEFLLIFIAGLILGGILGYYFDARLKRPDGVLVIDDSREDKTKWNLQVNSLVEEVPKKKRIVFSVNVVE